MNVETANKTMNEQRFSWLAFQPLLDSALPIGGFAHSFGLETFVQQGRVQTLDDLEGYCRVMIRGAWAPADGLLIKRVYELAAQSEESRDPDLWIEAWEADQRLHVQRAARETREGLQKMGRRLIHLGQEIYPELPWSEVTEGIRRGQCPGTYPLIHGWLSLRLGVPLRMAVEGYLYNSLFQIINSALRLMSMGQTQGQKLLVKLLPECSLAWQSVESLSFADAYTVSPDSDIAMMQHETLYSRLFMS